MPRAFPIQTNFTSGEIAPGMQGRVDVARYANGVASLQNFIVRPQGGIYRRSGTRFIAETKYLDKKSVLRNFIFSNTMAYVLEFGNTYIRIYMDGGELPVGSPADDADLSTAPTDAATVLSAPTDAAYVLGQESQLRWRDTPVTVTSVYYTTVTLADHGMATGDMFYFASATTLPSGTALNTTYTAVKTSNSTFLIKYNGAYVLHGYGGVGVTLTSGPYGGTAAVLPDQANLLGAPIDEATILRATPTFEIASPYLEDDLAGLDVAQAGDVLYITHEDYPPYKLSRFASDNWTLEPVVFIDGPYLDENTDLGATVLVASYINRVMLKSSSITFGASNVGEYVEYRDPETGVWLLALGVAVYAADGVTAASTGPCMLCTALPCYQPASPAVVVAAFTATNVATTEFDGAFVRSDRWKYLRETESSPGNGNWRRITGIKPSTVSSDVLLTAITDFTMVSYSFPTSYITVVSRTQTAELVASTNTFASADVGRWIRMSFSNKVLAGKITAVATQTSASIDLLGDERSVALPYDETSADILQDGGLTTHWRLGAWSETTGWPSRLTFHEQRAVFARTTLQPETLWFSVTQDFENFAPTDDVNQVNADNAINYTIASGVVNIITWLSPGPTLLVGTIGQEWQVKATSISEGISPSNISISPQTNHGAIDLAGPQRVGTAVVFIQRTGNKVREMTYSFELDSFVGKDMTVVSEHILREHDGGKYIVLQREPDCLLWVACNDGSLVGITYERDQEVTAWHNHNVGGNVESLTVVPNAGNTQDVLYLIVNRVINGQSVRYIEQMLPLWQGVGEYIYLDCSLTYDGLAATTFRGLDHLEGDTVTVVADGAKVGEFTITNGSFTLTEPASNVHAGKEFRSLVKTLPVEGGSQLGTSQGKTKRISKCTLRLLNSIMFKYGKDTSTLDTESFRDTIGSMDASPSLFTGDKSVKPELGHESDGTFVIVQDDPYPLNILAIMPILNTTEQ